MRTLLFECPEHGEYEIDLKMVKKHQNGVLYSKKEPANHVGDN